MKADGALYEAITSQDIKQVQWALSNGADPRSCQARRSLLEHAAALGFAQAVECMHVHTIALAHSQNKAPPPQDNPYAEDHASNMVAAAISGGKDALLALATTSAPFHVDQFAEVLYAALDPACPDPWRDVFPILNEHFVGGLGPGVMAQCASSLIVTRIPVYPPDAWTSMIQMGWVGRQELLEFSRHKPSMKKWALTLVLSSAVGKIESNHLIERLEWLCHAGFDPELLAQAIEQNITTQSLTFQQPKLGPTLRSIAQKVGLDGGTPQACTSATPPTPRL